MTATLAQQIPLNFAEAAKIDSFFSKNELEKIRQIETREQAPVGHPLESCKTNLFFGFFFDGTRNNYNLAEFSRSHSNVARLYDCYPGENVPDVLANVPWKYQRARYAHFFKVYIPGVGTPFPQVNDTGTGIQEAMGAAVGKYGQRRIVWALVQAVNNVHRYFLKAPCVQEADLIQILNSVELNQDARRFMKYTSEMPALGFKNVDRVARAEFEQLLRKLHVKTVLHRPDLQTGKCQKKEPGTVKTIYVSVFGFSRGATQARAFVNWFRSLCQLDALILGRPEGSLTLGGFDVHIDFVGLFDTVASIGSANTHVIVDGHGAWADAEDSLRIAPGLRCVHLVAAHELRRSFPVDSILVGNNDLPYGCEEIVVPGVHSDIGGGYCPREQGKGIDQNGDDMLSRIPLLMMYRAARLSGVPLKLEFAESFVQRRFAISINTIKAFNAYIKSCKVTEGAIHKIMREQAQKQMIWRMVRTVSGKRCLQETESFLRASAFDQNDLYSAACEFEAEINHFLAWMAEKGKGFKAVNQGVGFKGGHKAEWEEIATWWGKWEDPTEDVLNFFDEYVHDSRAWFKLSGADSEEKMRATLETWVRRRKAADMRSNIRKKVVGRGVPPDLSDSLTEDERQAANQYEKSGKIPRIINSGREPFALCQAGYLRYRRIYGGWDSVYLS